MAVLPAQSDLANNQIGTSLLECPAPELDDFIIIGSTYNLTVDGDEEEHPDGNGEIIAVSSARKKYVMTGEWYVKATGAPEVGYSYNALTATFKTAAGATLGTLAFAVGPVTTITGGGHPVRQSFELRSYAEFTVS